MAIKKQQLNKKAKIRTDGLLNAITSLGVLGKARTPSSQITNPKIFTTQDLGFMYGGDGFAKRIIDLIAEEMTREWISLNGDQDAYLIKYLEKLSAQQNFCDLVRWSRLFGGAIILIGANDGRNLEDELNLNNIRTIEFLRVIDRSEILVYPKDYYLDPLNEKYGQVEFYTITPNLYGIINEKSYIVHSSRVLRLDGDIVPNFMKKINIGWGFSILQTVYSRLIGLLQSYEYSSEIIHDFIINIFSIKNLSSTLQTANGEARIKKRMEIVNYSKSVINSVVIEAGTEDYKKETTNIAGLTDLINTLEMSLAAVTGIPYMILMGRSPSGLNATGDNEIRGWYDRISMMQEQQIKPLLKKLLEIIVLAKDCKFVGDLDDVTIEFNPLWQYEQKDLITMRNQQAQTDAIYLERGVLQEQEVKDSRFGDNYSFDTKLDESIDLDSSNDDEELKEQMAQMQEMVKGVAGSQIPSGFNGGVRNLTIPQSEEEKQDSIDNKTLPFKEKMKSLLQKMFSLINRK